MVLKRKNQSAPIEPSISEKLDEWANEHRLSSGNRTSIYISTPITTGPLFVEWTAQNRQILEGINDAEYQTLFKAEVILPNVQRAASIIEKLRWQLTGSLINPTGLNVPGWPQYYYHLFWTEVLRQFAQRVIFLNGWEYSRGCTIEFKVAQECGIDCIDEALFPINILEGVKLIGKSIKAIKSIKGETRHLEKIWTELKNNISVDHKKERKLYKDKILDHLAHTANVAQFVSFAPGFPPKQRYSRINGYPPNHSFNSLDSAVKALLKNSPEKAVNIRSYSPESPEGNPFIKNLKSIDEVIIHIRKLACDKNLYTIVNEVIDESDGGVSGVCHRGSIEFAPDATPRCVDDPEIETAIFPFDIGLNFLKTVYGFEADLKGRDGARVEFSIHPAPRGCNNKNTIIWQSEQRPGENIKPLMNWPNAFSRMIGDKTYGLLVAHLNGFLVPRTIVYNDRLFPFVFGIQTGSTQVVTRTSPAVKEPGYYLSKRGWYDPYDVLKGRILIPTPRNDKNRPSPLRSVLVQQEIPAEYSGRALNMSTNEVHIEGVSGSGDNFMLGDQGAEPLPNAVKKAVIKCMDRVNSLIGSCSLEWVFSGGYVWVVQLNPLDLATRSNAKDPSIEWVTFNYKKNMIEDFRRKVFEIKGSGKGVEVIGNVSPLSHLGEIAEVYGVPVIFSRIIDESI